MAVLYLMFHLVLRSGMVMTCWTWPRITSYHTPVQSWWGAMTWQLPCQVLPLLTVRMVSGHMTSQYVRKLPYKKTSQVNINQYQIIFFLYLVLFIDFLPPPIKYSVTGSSWAVGRVGQLIVRPGGILHLDCLADRRRGNPSWRWTNLYKEYPTG